MPDAQTLVNADFPAVIDEDDADFLIKQIESLTDQRITIKVSEWVQGHRYLPKELSSKEGFWDNDYTPYLVEIMDCFSEESTVQKIAFMKGAQIGASTGVMENAIGYMIDLAPKSMMYVSADKALAEKGIELKIDRMLQSVGLTDKLQSSTRGTRRSGNTTGQKEFPGGFLLAIGARNPGKLRQMSIQVMLLDELDGFPDSVGNEGSPVTLAETRTKAFAHTRKILYISTPTVLQTSKINPLFEKGDQRKYMIPCRHCGEFQDLEWRGHIEADGETKDYGITYLTTEKGILKPESVGYTCKHCFCIMRDYDKSWFLKRGHWHATSETEEIGLRSYHLNALYSPVGMYSWTHVVYDWLEAWDAVRNTIKDIDKRIAFRNTVEGLPWEDRGESPKLEIVQGHRRMVYGSGEIPNSTAIDETGGPVLVLTAAADIHKDWIGVEVMGWCRASCSYSIEWCIFQGDTTDLSDKGPWQCLRDLYDKQYTADDGKLYYIAKMLIDSGYNTDSVYQFCKEFNVGVHPIKGEKTYTKAQSRKEFLDFKTRAGNIGYHITTTIYKDRLARWLRQEWDGVGLQPIGYPSYPQDYDDTFFKQYTVETRKSIKCPRTKKHLRFEWHGPSTCHAWDCRVYNMCAIDLLALEVCQGKIQFKEIDGGMIEIEGWDYDLFWQYLEDNNEYFVAPNQTMNLV